MPLTQLNFRPGVDRERTRYANEDGWIAGDKIRFRGGYPEKIGGWRRWTAEAFLGVCRTLRSWVTLNGTHYVGVGTNERFYAARDSGYMDITPARVYAVQDNALDPVSTQNGFSAVELALTGHGLLTGDVVWIEGSSGVGGIDAEFINGRHQITRIDADTFSFDTFFTANATATGGGSVDFTLHRTRQYLSGALQAATGSSLIEITMPAHLLRTGDTVIISDATALGGEITDEILNGDHAVVEILTANTFTIDVGVQADASDVGAGGDISIEALLTPGAALPVATSGWGSGGWGMGPWGIGVPGVADIRLWTADNFGEDLVFGYRRGPIYWWSPTDPPDRGHPITLLGDSATPLVHNGLLSYDPARILIAWGVNDYGQVQQDRALVRWSAQEDMFTWMPSITNQAGSLRLESGSEVITIIATRQELLALTDRAVYSLQYVDPPVVFTQQLLAEATTIASPNSAIAVMDAVYWMGRDHFYIYDGQVRPLDCSLQRHVFRRINTSQYTQVHAGHNPEFTEIWWFYCVGSSTEINEYVVYNYKEQIWYYGALNRTAWTIPARGRRPLATTQNGAIVEHEFGTDDLETGQAHPIPAYILSADMDLDDGDMFTFIRRVLPDVEFEGSTGTPEVGLRLYAMRNAGTPPRGEKDETVQRTAATTIGPEFTGQVFMRIRGRHIRFEISSEALGTAWQLGAVRIDAQPDGEK